MSKKNGSDNNIVPNLKKLPLAEYFAALPKAERRPVIISAPKEDVITAIGHKPLYGNRSGKQGKTHWMAFLKVR